MAVWLHAANSMLTATTMPSAVAEIGGLNLISWSFALYLVASITAGAATVLIVLRYGIRSTMLRAALLYGIGCCICASAPSMPVILIGRSLQGFGGGALLALVYISQDRFFPNRFVPKIVACMSMIWMLSAFCGPLIGGAFSTWGVWRLAYWVFALQAVILIVAVYRLLAVESEQLDLEAQPIPTVRLMLLAASILLVSLAGAEFHPVISPVLLLLGCLSLAFFVLRDHKTDSGRILPLAACDITHPIFNGVLTTFLLCLSIMSFLVYGPLILIELYGLTPFHAGMIVMLETLAWGIAAIVFSGASPDKEPMLIRTGSALVVVGLIFMAILLPHGPLWAVAVTTVISNGGFGMMWGFIIKRLVGTAPAEDRDRAGSMVPITQQTGFAMGAALSGFIANGFGLSEDMTVEGIQRVAYWLFAAFVPAALIGNVTAWRFVSHTPDQSEQSRN